MSENYDPEAEGEGLEVSDLYTEEEDKEWNKAYELAEQESYQRRVSNNYMIEPYKTCYFCKNRYSDFESSYCKLLDIENISECSFSYVSSVGTCDKFEEKIK
jgi:hypothetical protein